MQEFVSPSLQASFRCRTYAFYLILTKNDPQVVYFKYITELRIVDDDSGRFEIRFKNYATDVDYVIFTQKKDIAIEGYGALVCMIESNK